MNWNPLSAIYGGVVGARNALYDRRLLRSRPLQGPVISVGNLSAGGSGKTPFVILLGELLKARGVRFDVLSRGYGRHTRGVLQVDPGGSSREFGDEPLLIARRLQVPVVVGEDRHEAGLFAESRFGPQTHLLDDGLQHRGLARDFDIVLVTPEDARDRLLPAGRLREPLSSLQRADAVVLTSGAAAESFPLAGKTVWRVRRGIVAQSVPRRPVGSVAIYSEADRNSLHVRFADEAICIGPPQLAQSYLNIPAVISAAEIANVDAIHPGYRPAVGKCQLCRRLRGLPYQIIGPTPDVIRLRAKKKRHARP